MEERAGGDESSGTSDLKALIVRARDLVKVLANLPEENLAERTRDAIRRAELPEMVERLAPKLEASYPEDFGKMRQAAARLEVLAEGIPPETPPSLLVVDDNEDNRELLRRMLERQGYTVALAAGGEECLDRLEREQFDIVLLDVMMPGLSGFEVLSRIKENPATKSVPVIVVSALGESSAAIRCLKNPLNFITNFSSLSREIAEDIEREFAKPQPDRAELHALLQTLRENLDRVETHGKRADHIVRGMLQHSHGQPGKRELTDINALVEEALNLAYHGMRAQNSSFHVSIGKSLAPNLPQIPVVAQDISRVLVNILNNAFYAVGEERKSATAGYTPAIRAATLDRGDSIEILLEDNGPGIPPAIAQKIFDPFFTTKPAGEGTGLGLSISYDIVVRTHGGALTSETEEGRLTRFRVVLPKR